MSQAFITYNQSNDRIKIYTHIKPFLQEDGATKRISLRNSTSKASWGWGNKENFTEKFNKQSKLGMGPTKRISLRNSTSKASWGWGPNKENFTEKFNKQSKLGMGPNKENFTEKFNKQSKLGMGPQQREFH